MSPESISALVLSALAILGALYSIGGGIFQVGVTSQRFKESGEQRDAEDKRIREDMEAAFALLREQMDGRFKMVGNDLNKMGAKINMVKGESDTGYVEIRRDAQRHHHNLSMAIMLSAPNPKEGEVVALLMEKK
jgi:hypothetical protein